MLVPLLIQFVKLADLFGWRTSHYSLATGIWIWNPSYSLRNKVILQVDLKRKNSKSSYALLLLEHNFKVGFNPTKYIYIYIYIISLYLYQGVIIRSFV
jgi:hypothetical protein